MHTVRDLWDLRMLRRSAQAYAVVAAWRSAGLFTALADGKPRRIDELPGDDRAIQIMIPILLQLGLLCGDGTRWAMTENGLDMFERGELDLPFAERDFADLARLGQVLAHGGPVETLPAPPPRPEPAVADFQAMLHRRSAVEARELARWLAPQIPAGGRVLDLGGGHGRFSAALHERGFEPTLFDQPEVIALTEARYGDRFELIGGDFMASDLGGPYDAVLLSDIVHNLDETTNRTLLARAVAVLRPGGVLAVRDQFFEDDARTPERPACFGLVMLMYTSGGRCYSLNEARGWLRGLDLELAQHVRLTDTDSSLLIACRDPTGAGSQ